MKPEQQRICIAEACGWCDEHNRGLAWSKRENRALIVPGSKVEAARKRMGLPCEPGIDTYPDYLNDLNAMHEAEQTIAPDMVRVYQEHLVKITVNPNLFHKDITGWVFHATASQRAEAFLRTIGKWKE